MTKTNITIGILAHVDAGKTTLSEQILLGSGAIRRAGRVDHGDTFLDTDEMEKKRGITIYSKLARFKLEDQPFTLLDTPGHADFSPEMERALRVLDYAVLVISAPDLMRNELIDPQVQILWRLLERHKVPAILFVNKMDQLRAEHQGDDEELRKAAVQRLVSQLGEGPVLFDARQLCEDNMESTAVCDEELMLEYMESSRDVTDEDVVRLTGQRKLFPVYCGAALKGEGTEALLEGLGRYCRPKDYPDSFGALVYKISRDEQNTRLVWMKLTGGSISVRDSISQENHRYAAASEQAKDDAGETDSEEENLRIEEKVSGIRLYSGEKYEALTRASAGEIVAVAGLSAAQAGDGLGLMQNSPEDLLAPVQMSRVTTLEKTDRFTLLSYLRTLEEEEPMLHVAVSEQTGDITVQIMGRIQIQILQQQILERFGVHAIFSPGRTVYKETIRRPVLGVGHFEPLRHYAEVHLLLEPGEPGSGLVFENRTPPNLLAANWQKLIMSHLEEKSFRGVLTGSGITDIKISLLGGRGSIKHTCGGDFRQATWRAVRQGLMNAQNILLEPFFDIRAVVPQANVGRVLTDIGSMGGGAFLAEYENDGTSAGTGLSVVSGYCPASSFGDYPQELTAFTAGRGTITATLSGYRPCHNAKEVIEEAAYDPELDRYNPSYSVFCSHGAGTPVAWDQVYSKMHLDTGWRPSKEEGPFLTDDYYTYAQEGDFLKEIAQRDTPDASLPYRQEDAADPENAGSDEENAAAGHVIGKNAAKEEEQDFAARSRAYLAEQKELDTIFERTYGPVRQKILHEDNRAFYELLRQGFDEETAQEILAARNREPDDEKNPSDPRYQDKIDKKRQKAASATEYLLVDGYNIIFAWSDLKELAQRDIKSARDSLLDILSDYAGYSRNTVIVVFDAYKVAGGRGEVYRYHNIDVVYTKEAETADLYIEKTAHELGKNHKVTVATSDAVEQVIIFGTGALRLSARGLLEQILIAKEEMREKYLS